MCDKVCQNSMMIFLFIYVYLSVCELGLCSVERRKYMTQTEKKSNAILIKYQCNTNKILKSTALEYFISVAFNAILSGYL